MLLNAIADNGEDKLPAVSKVSSPLSKKIGENKSRVSSSEKSPGLEVSKLEGIIPAIETAHAFAVFKYLDFKPNDIIVVNFSGRGDKDLNTYIDYFKL